MVATQSHVYQSKLTSILYSILTYQMQNEKAFPAYGDYTMLI